MASCSIESSLQVFERPKERLSTSMNPLQSGISTFLLSYKPSEASAVNIQKDVPKRFTRYGSLLLLGPTFTTHPQTWAGIFASLTREQTHALLECIVRAFRDGSLTHLAVNAPISPLTEKMPTSESKELLRTENTMRSPTGLLPVYGDFGPSEHAFPQPTDADFRAAYWTEATQLKNIYQVWAPRWTMFSRGNITEKARILQDKTNSNPFSGLAATTTQADLAKIDVVDFYVGIGYFAFCYLTRGVRRVWGWELNGWSVEGLRRGCLKNAWQVKIVKLDDNGAIEDKSSVEDLVIEIEEADHTPNPIRCIVFWGNNKYAATLLEGIGKTMQRRGHDDGLNIQHCNLGLLPTSEGSWDAAVKVLNHHETGWCHVHENVDITKIADKELEVISGIQDRAQALGYHIPSISCAHIEQVKTYAPGVMHCVFDIELSSIQ